MSRKVEAMNDEETVWRAAVELTASQISEAVRILESQMPNDIRTQEGALIGSVVQALAVNFQSLVIAQSGMHLR